MATASVNRKSNASKATKTAKVNLVELAAAAWAGVASVAKDNADRDSLKEGKQYEVKLHIAAEIDGQIYQSNYAGPVTVGHDSTRASSVGATASEVIAYLLSKVNAATRESTLRELADVFAANGGKLPVSDEAVEQADEAMKKLRQKVDQPVRGSVRCKLEPSQPSLGIVGRD